MKIKISALRLIFFYVFLVFGIFVQQACWGWEYDRPTCSVSYNAFSIDSGEMATLKWNSTNDADGKLDFVCENFDCSGDTCTYNQSGRTGTVDANGSGTAIWNTPVDAVEKCTFTAENSNGAKNTCTASMNVKVYDVPFPELKLFASQTRVSLGQSFTIYFEAKNSIRCGVFGGDSELEVGWRGFPVDRKLDAVPVEEKGERLIFPLSSGSKTYSMTCMNKKNSITQSVTVEVGPKNLTDMNIPKIEFSTSSTKMSFGQSATFSYKMEEADVCMGYSDTETNLYAGTIAERWGGFPMGRYKDFAGGKNYSEIVYPQQTGTKTYYLFCYNVKGGYNFEKFTIEVEDCKNIDGIDCDNIYCGEAYGKYFANNTSFRSINNLGYIAFCADQYGFRLGQKIPLFPEKGSSEAWICKSFGSVRCIASREENEEGENEEDEPQNDLCGPASRNYSSSETSFEGGFCKEEVVYSQPLGLYIDFPVIGGGTAWFCHLSKKVMSYCTATRKVTNDLPICSASYGKSSIDSGEMATLKWNSTNDADGKLDFVCENFDCSYSQEQGRDICTYNQSGRTGTVDANGSVTAIRNTPVDAVEKCTFTAENSNGAKTTCTASMDVKAGSLISNCGTANRTYEFEETSFGNDTICSSQSVAKPKDVKFPEPGKKTNWQCRQTNDSWITSIIDFLSGLIGRGDDEDISVDGKMDRKVSNCQAERKNQPLEPITPGCGDSSGRYLANDNAFRSSNFCAEGYKITSSLPTFPEKGSSIDWVCRESRFLRFLSKSVVCTANRGEGEDEKDISICEDKCGDGICQEIVCYGTGCPCPETVENCPIDCGDEKKDDKDKEPEIYTSFCGPASGNYSSTETAFRGGLCKEGSVSYPEDLVFPRIGKGISWICYNEDDRTKRSNCSANVYVSPSDCARYTKKGTFCGERGAYFEGTCEGDDCEIGSASAR